MSDTERDAWLREALRHAPDSGALPPRELSETILASARAATRSAQGLPAHRASHMGPKHPLAAFWDWLARPSVAAGFASVLAATLVGLMWWDRPMDEMLADVEFTVVHELIHLELSSLPRSDASRSEEEHAVNQIARALLALDHKR